MAEGVTPEPSGGELEPQAGRELETTHSKELAPYTPQVRHGHETKFRLLYGVLAGVAVAAVAAAGIFIAAGKPPTPPEWSQWKPTSSGDEALGQIADHVALAYRLPTGEQLVGVYGRPLEVQGTPVRVVLRPDRKNAAPSDGQGALFTLCGLGKHCSIKAGKPSPARTRLMRREAYELALYTFRYVKDAKQVVVIMPPPGTKPAYQAMFFKREKVEPQLARPLRFALPGGTPSIKSLEAGPAKRFIDRTTRRDSWYYNVVPLQDASVMLELARFPIHKTQKAKAAAGSSSKKKNGTP
jgi:hypothetical protein